MTRKIVDCILVHSRQQTASESELPQSFTDQPFSEAGISGPIDRADCMGWAQRATICGRPASLLHFGPDSPGRGSPRPTGDLQNCSNAAFQSGGKRHGGGGFQRL